MTGDRAVLNQHRFNSDEILTTATVVSSWLALSSVMYIRGSLDASPLAPEEFAKHVAQHGPYWPLVLFPLGMAGMLAGSLVYWRTKG